MGQKLASLSYRLWAYVSGLRKVTVLKFTLIGLLLVLFISYGLHGRTEWFFSNALSDAGASTDPTFCGDEEQTTWWINPNRTNLASWQKIPEEERTFPIAFTIIAFERPDQVWRLLKAIYRPQNFYCIHMDKKQTPRIKDWLRTRIKTCLPDSSNVHFLSAIDVQHSYMSVLEADLLCMRLLWQLTAEKTTPTKATSTSQRPPWRYLINLTGQEFPLKNNLELTRILRVLNGANIVQQLKFDFYRYPILHRPPHGLKLYKGSVHVVLSWAFVDFIFTDSRVHDFLNFLPYVGVPDEAFFSTLNHNAHLRAPGGFPYGDEAYRRGEGFVNRWKKFWPAECHGEWRHLVCIPALEDLQPLFRLQSPELFINKFVMHINSHVLDVTEGWFYDRQDWLYRHQNFTLTPLDFFANQPHVKYQKNRTVNTAEGLM
uniref:Uncharacterized protein n=1 Tax=Schistocephalus solidus TaxID=70667 RepID=A0A0V0JAV1_SCHSO